MSRPYFETEVVKVKKEKKKCSHNFQKIIPRKECDVYQCFYCGRLKYQPIENMNNLPEVRKGNWVNGENLDKIKFPCFCSYIDKISKIKCYAEMHQYDKGYKLSRLFQADCESIFYGDISLKKLIINLDIHILKGKITIFEGEE